MTDHRIPLAGVIGNPIAHSRSPALHGHWLSRYGLKGHYVPMHVEHADLPQVLRILPRTGFVGVNLTIPHKEAGLKIADLITDRAALIGAANTLIFRPDGKIHADNTDGFGFLANLHQTVPDWQARLGPAAVFGSGGAARAIVVALLDAGTPELRLTNRTRGRADALRAEFGTRVSVWDWHRGGEMLEDCITVVNTTALGMAGGQDVEVSFARLGSAAVVADIVYSPLETGFLRAAARQGCRTVDGLGMLLHQAVPGFERWFGRRPEVDDELRAAVLAA